jgi:spore coat protein U-like protein
MFIKKQVSLLAVALASLAMCGSVLAGTASSTTTVDATLTTACEVSATSAIHFGTFAALESTGDKTADSGSSFRVACSSGAVPKIYSLSAHTMVSGANNFPFNLSLTAGAASDDLPATGVTGVDPGMTKDGSLHDVVLYGKVLAANF